MFRTYNLHTHDISIRNLILLFLTIVLGFASLMVLGYVEIPSVIDNAWQTIAKISITEDGTDDAALEMGISSGGIYINPAILDDAGSFSGRVLGIDDSGNVVYALSNSLVVSGVSGGGGGDGLWTGVLGGDIYNINNGHVGIGNNTPTSGKLHVTSIGETELYLEEANSGNSTNIHLQNHFRTWSIGNQGLSDRFYIGQAGGTIDFVITPVGFVGIGTIDPKANLQVVGNFIAGHSGNNIGGGGSYNLRPAFIGGGSDNNIYTAPGAGMIGGQNNQMTGDTIGGHQGAMFGFIGGGESNTIKNGTHSAIIGGATNIISGAKNLSNSHSFIGGGINNYIYDSSKSAIIGGVSNTIIGESSSIGGGNGNNVSGDMSFIGGGYKNILTGITSSIVGGSYNQINGMGSFIGGGGENKAENKVYGNYSSVVGGMVNRIIDSLGSFIGGGSNNTIYSGAKSFIGGGNINVITGNSSYSVIPGGKQNRIENAEYSFNAGVKAKNYGYNNTFVWNSDENINFEAGKAKTFLINVPLGIREGGVGINTNNPKGDLHVGGSGVVVFQPQTNNPQSGSGNCTTEGSVIFASGDHKLCYCAEGMWKFVDNNNACLSLYY